MSAFHAPALAIADELGVFTCLAGGAKTIDELAAALDIEVRAIETVTGLVAALGFATQTTGRYELTDVARTYLLPSSPYYWGPMLARMRDVPLDCRRLLDALHRKPGAQAARVTEMWQAPRPPPEALRAFTRAMHAHSFSLAMRVIDRLDLRGVRRLLDVGGGSGSYSIAAIRHDPKIAATVLDLPVVCEMARSYAAELGAADRFDTAPLDMFVDAWPSGFDRVLMCDIFHDWADAQCRQLTERAFAALRPGGKVLLHEMVLAATKDGPVGALAYSMVMLFVAQGRQRTAGELSEILTTAGFIDVRVSVTAGGYVEIAGTKPS